MKPKRSQLGQTNQKLSARISSGEHQRSRRQRLTSRVRKAEVALSLNGSKTISRHQRESEGCQKNNEQVVVATIEPKMSTTTTTTTSKIMDVGNLVCHGCNQQIGDKFLLRASDKFWHDSCLKCDRCHAQLGELGPTFYERANMNLCRQDYFEMFGHKAICSVCDKLIFASEMVMRAKQNVYHLECFACQLCGLRFCVGDRFHLCENKIVCQYDYDEHILPIQESMRMSSTSSSSSLAATNQLQPIEGHTLFSLDSVAAYRQLDNARPEVACQSIKEPSETNEQDAQLMRHVGVQAAASTTPEVVPEPEVASQAVARAESSREAESVGPKECEK